MVEQKRWELGDWVMAHPRRGWFPYMIRFQRRRVFQFHGERWRARHEINATPGGFYAFLCVGPAKPLTAREERALRSRHAFNTLDRAIRGLGYEGGWSIDEGICGYWRWRPETALEAHEELGFLDSLRIPKDGRVTHGQRRSVRAESGPWIGGSRKQVTASWKFFELAKAARPDDCKFVALGLSRRTHQRVEGIDWDVLLSVYSAFGELSADILPSLTQSRNEEHCPYPTKEFFRQTKRGFPKAGFDGSWHHDHAQPFGDFFRRQRPSIEAFASEQQALERVRLADVLKLGQG